MWHKINLPNLAVDVTAGSSPTQKPVMVPQKEGFGVLGIHAASKHEGWFIHPSGALHLELLPKKQALQKKGAQKEQANSSNKSQFPHGGINRRDTKRHCYRKHSKNLVT